METAAQRQLLDTLERLIAARTDGLPQILNIGAGQSVVLENRLMLRGSSFVCDRVDIEDCAVQHERVQHCFLCSVEKMQPLESNQYELAFSNFLMEHVVDLPGAASEILRVLKPGGHYIATIPNPRALEIRVAKHTPLQFHRLVRGGSGWETHYTYADLEDLRRIFGEAGFEVVVSSSHPSVESYLVRFRFLRPLGRAYDATLEKLRLRGLMGHACMVFRKPAATS
jgi:SAM-dependent methyltransferase